MGKTTQELPKTIHRPQTSSQADSLLTRVVLIRGLSRKRPGLSLMDSYQVNGTWP